MIRALPLVAILAISLCSPKGQELPSRAVEVQGAPTVEQAERPTNQAPRPSMGHCESGERAWFHCETTSNKVLTVCGAYRLTGAEAWLQYRFGPAGQAELEWPEERTGSVDRFRFEHRMHVRSWSENLFFDSGDFRFTVWTQEGAGEEDHSAGVMVEQDGREVGRHACSMPTLRAELASLSTAVPHGPEHQPE